MTLIYFKLKDYSKILNDHHKFQGKRKKKKKNIVGDNQPRNNQHALSLKEEDTAGNPMT
jgi:hypothetical protein